MATSAVDAIVTLKDGMEEPYVLFWPVPQDGVSATDQGAACFVISRRAGGLLLGLPMGIFASSELEQVSDADESSVLGPYQEMVVPAVRDDGFGAAVQTGTELDVLVIDVSLEILPGLFKLSEVDHPPELIVGFGEEEGIFPDGTMLMHFAQEWLEGSGAATQRISFYSAQESEELVETPKAVPKAKGLGAKSKAGGAPKKATPAKAVAEQIKAMSALLPKLASQMEELQKEQMTMRDFILQQGLSPPTRPSQQPVTMQPSQFAELLTSPPPLPVRRTAATPKIESTVPVQEQMEEAAQADPQGDPLAMAVLEQSRALTSLVAHLQAGDPLLDSQATSSGNTSRGAVGREKLQKELANRSGGFLLAVTQNMFRRLRPASPLPQSLEEMKETDMSMLQYLERFGGYGNCKDMGVVQYALSFILDMAVRRDMEGIQEHIALLVVAIDQYVQDGGRWELGFQLLLAEDPPNQMYSYKSPVATQTGRMRAFSPLCPQRWATISIAYTKELDFILNRRLEIAKKASQPPPAQPDVSPKKKGKYPKGKATSGDQEKEDQQEA